MKKIITILLILLPLINYSQNWSLINIHEVYNYKVTNSNYISNTIFIDSIKVNNLDSIFFLNRIVIDCPECDTNNLDQYKISNQGQFLQKKVTKTLGGIYHFEGENDFFIAPYMGVDESWEFDTLNNIFAYVDSIYEDIVFGVIDSIKTISTDNNHSIIIAKNHGIIEFKQGTNTYSLIGMEKLNLGETLPQNKDFYNFNIGDVFQYETTANSFSGSRNGIEKQLILDKVENDSQFIYSIRIITQETLKTPLCGYQYFEGDNTLNITFNKNYDSEFSNFTNHLNINYPNKILKHPDIGNELRILKINKDMIFNRISMGRGFFPQAPNFNTEIGYNYLNNSDTLIQEYASDCYKDIYVVGLGQVYRYNKILDNLNKKVLTGFVKNGDTTGVITSDGFLLNINSREEFGLSVFPNISNGIYNIEFTEGTELSFELFTITGKRILFKQNHSINNFQLDIRNKNTGIYFLRVNDGNSSKTYKLIKH